MTPRGVVLGEVKQVAGRPAGYRFVKIWAVLTGKDDSVQPGEVVMVGLAPPTKEVVLSVTDMVSNEGHPYKVLLVRRADV
jgi:hypothetical protein